MVIASLIVIVLGGALAWHFYEHKQARKAKAFESTNELMRKVLR